MADEQIEQNTLRDTLETNFEASEAGVLPTAEERARDEAGRFAKSEPKPEVTQKVEVPVEVQPPPRPTTWKKEYLPIYDKLASGQALTPEEGRKLAEYSNQRENEYKTGVSTYRTEAQSARELQEAVTPFLSDLQSHGMTPSQWIKDVGQVHQMLMRGSPEQKIQLFQNLAQRYAVPLAAVQQQGPVPPILSQIMQPIGDLRQQISALQGWKTKLEQDAQQYQVSAMENEVHKFAADEKTYPHFDAVRESMAQLLESGAARDLPTAYRIAVAMDDGLQEQVLNQRLSEKQTTSTSAASQARSKAISPRSATPSGQVTSSGAKDRRSLLSEAFDAHGGGRV